MFKSLNSASSHVINQFLMCCSCCGSVWSHCVTLFCVTSFCVTAFCVTSFCSELLDASPIPMPKVYSLQLLNLKNWRFKWMLFILKPGCHLCNLLYNTLHNYALAWALNNATWCFYGCNCNGQTNSKLCSELHSICCKWQPCFKPTSKNQRRKKLLAGPFYIKGIEPYSR